VDPRLIWLLAAIAVVVIAAVVWFEMRRRHSERLRTRFGPEYERTVHTVGNVKQAEASLEARAKRVEALHIRPLSADDAARYGSAWRRVQERFVDEPRRAVEQADALVAETMQRLAQVFSHARQQLEHQWDRGEDVTTEDLRVALQRYRAFFDRLLSV
jgi:hypothetical protein